MLKTAINKRYHIQPQATYADRKQRIFNFLRETPVGVLYSMYANVNPHAAVIYFSIDKRFQISFLTKADTKKYDNLFHFNHIMLTVYEPLTQTTAQITGRAEEITASSEINGVAGAILSASLKTSDNGLPPISKLEAGPYVAFNIKSVQIRMAVYSRADPGSYNEIFESIESFELESGYV